MPSNQAIKRPERNKKAKAIKVIYWGVKVSKLLNTFNLIGEVNVI